MLEVSNKPVLVVIVVVVAFVVVVLFVVVVVFAEGVPAFVLFIVKSVATAYLYCVCLRGCP